MKKGFVKLLNTCNLSCRSNTMVIYGIVAFIMKSMLMVQLGESQEIAVCNKVYNIEEEALHIVSPGNYTGYGKDMNCNWLINASSNDVILYKLHNIMVDCGDGVSTYDGKNSKSASITSNDCTVGSPFSTPYYVTSGPSLHTEFITDNQSPESEKGFYIDAISAKDMSDCPVTDSEIQLVATSDVKILTSPNFPKLYSNDFRCTWKITTNNPAAFIRLKYLFLEMDKYKGVCYDTVKIYNGSQEIASLCDNTGFTDIMTMDTKLNQTTIVFTSDDKQVERGFKLSYQQVEPDMTKAQETTTSVQKTTSTAQWTLTPERTTENPSYNGPCSSLCSGGTDWCYKPLNCTHFSHCYSTGSTCSCIERICSFGTLWSRESGICDSATNVICSDDPCILDMNLKAYPSGINCKSYYVCSNVGMKRSIPMCCNDYHSYDPKEKQCVPNEACGRIPCTTQSSMYEPDIISSSTKSPEQLCGLVADRSNPARYFYKGTGFNLPRICAPGTIFDESFCTCIHGDSPSLPPAKRECKESIDIDFDNNSTQNNNRAIPAYARDLQIVSASPTALFGRFNGKTSAIYIPYYSSKPIKHFVIRLRFYTDGKSGPDKQMLVSDCKLPNFNWYRYFESGKAKVPDLDIILDRITQNIIFLLAYTGPNGVQSNVLKIPYQPRTWNNVEYVYDGTNVYAKKQPLSAVERNPVTDSSTIKDVDGYIYLNSLLIGGCSDMDSFSGHLDMIKIYECVPRQ